MFSFFCVQFVGHKNKTKGYKSADRNKKKTGKSVLGPASRPSHQLLVVEREAKALQHGDEDDDVLLVGGQGAEHGGQFTEALLQGVDVEHHPAHPALREPQAFRGTPHSEATVIKH